MELQIRVAKSWWKKELQEGVATRSCREELQKGAAKKELQKDDYDDHSATKAGNAKRLRN